MTREAVAPAAAAGLVGMHLPDTAHCCFCFCQLLLQLLHILQQLLLHAVAYFS
jgi:hypothetical protein